ncbi:MAG: Rieske 2Fe-2S domain-containing protein [Chloroflexi bacterium]|nr:Rieske 2Fe-2S domain-containing protein [Chloroflexota bacterium]
MVAPTSSERWIAVARLEDLAEGSIIAAKAGERELVIVRHQGSIYALASVCPHRGGSLAAGKLQCGELTCPLHGFRYDLASGEATMPLDVPGVRTYKVRTEGGQLLVRL